LLELRKASGKYSSEDGGWRDRERRRRAIVKHFARPLPQGDRKPYMDPSFWQG